MSSTGFDISDYVNMNVFEQIDFSDYLNPDTFEDDVSEDAEARGSLRATECDVGSRTSPETDILSTNPESFHQPMQRAQDPYLFEAPQFPTAPFEDEISALQEATGGETVLSLQVNAPGYANKMANYVVAQGEAEGDGIESSEEPDQSSAASQSDDDLSLPQPTPSTSQPTYVKCSQGHQQSLLLTDATERKRNNKENVPPLRPVVARREATAAHSVLPAVAPRRSLRVREQQPVAGPSSVTLDSPASDESTGLDSDQELAAPTKRHRSTKAEVNSMEIIPCKASVCGLDGADCKHKLGKPTENKAHIKKAHPSLIPPTAGTAASTTGPLYHQGVLQTDEQIRDLVAKGALACTWAAASGDELCGSVCYGTTAQAGLARHVEEIHWGRKWGCDECTPRRPFSSQRALQKHRADKHTGAAAANVPQDAGVREGDGGVKEEENRPTKRRRL
ncbi:hypothetical protein VTO73DRAFT_11270 [Trametes versicolor]